MKITIPKWDKHNPRKDYKTIPWFRCSSRMYRDPKLRGLSVEAKWLWISLLCIACEENKRGVIECDFDWLADEIRFDLEILPKTLKILASKSLIELEEDAVTNVTCTSHERNYSKSRSKRTNEHCVTNVSAVVATDATAQPPPGSAVWSAYSGSYFARYGVAPVRNAKSNTNCQHLVSRLGIDAAISVVKFYLTHQNNFYLQKSHSLGLCLSDCESLHTQMLNGHTVTAATAVVKERQQTNIDAAQGALKLLEAQHERGP